MTTTTKKAPKPAEHPTYKAMITAALKDEGSKGMSAQKCLRYICTKYKVGTNARGQVKISIKRLLAQDYLVQTRGKGAAGSFKLSQASKEQAKKKPAAKRVKKATTAAKSPKKVAKPRKTPVKAKKPAAKKQKTAVKKAGKKPAAKKAVKKSPKKTVKKAGRKPAAKKAKTPKKKVAKKSTKGKK